VAGRGDAYQYLVDSIRNFPPRASVVAAMERAGLARVRTRALAGGIATLYSAWRI
jgi:demethylmenaquinone methyltransferase/2-methoxy-6-polyprenyl-1,4-benzoquinol methylase